MSLFLRIFLSFWLAAILLAGSFFLLGRFSGNEAIERTEAILTAQAEVVAALWLDGGHRATRRWFFQQNRQQRPQLLDQQGGSPFQRHRQNEIPWLKSPLTAGVKHLKFGRVAVVVALPGIDPPLYLVRRLDLGHMQRVPLSVRVLIAVLIIGLVSYMLAFVLSRRIKQLRSAAQVIAGGDLSSRVVIAGRDEISALANDFNLMTQRISEMMASQRQLVSDVSHELRSPLARLRIALELAGRAEDPALAFSRVEKEADELEQLVTDLLSLARIESGQSSLEMQPVPICELLNNIVADANFEGEVHQRSVELDPCDEVNVMGDPVLLHASIENVIRNALSYTPDGCKVTISLHRQQDQLMIIIEDQGPGVPDDALVRLFEPFSRVAEARDRDSGGYGLGLAITGRTLVAHGGSAVAANRPGGGLRVTLSLPIILER